MILDITVVEEQACNKINGLTITHGDPFIVPEDMSDVFSGKNTDAKELRKRAWRRRNNA